MRLEISRDNINELPDELLSFTLSLLPLREAARTSLLSHRWRYLWKTSVKFSRSLNLDDSAMNGSSYSFNMFSYERLLWTERKKFIEWVDQMLQLDYSPTVDSFRLRFHMNKSFSHLIDKWISEAVGKRVQNIEIDLSDFTKRISSILDMYTFPNWLFTQEIGSLVKSLSLRSCILETLAIDSFSSLVDVRLRNIPLKKDFITKLLSSCPNLEKLCLVGNFTLLDLKVSGSSLKLKDLTIIHCDRVSKIEIDAINLTRFEYVGNPIKISFLNVPQLSSCTIHNSIMSLSLALRYALRTLSRDLPKLESLLLSGEPFEKKKIPHWLPLFANLKKLVLMVLSTKKILWGLIPLVQASPHLQKLELHLHVSAKECEEVQRPSDSPFLHLKDIMLTGFRGASHEIQFTNYLLCNSPTLEKMTIIYEEKVYDYNRGIRDNDFIGLLGDPKEKKEMVKRTPAQLANVLRPGVQLQFV